MVSLLSRLAGGDLRSDGRSNQVVRLVLRDARRFRQLYEGLHSDDAVIRGRTADGLEKIARTRPDLLRPHLTELMRLARADEVAMVRMHLAMLFGHLSVFEPHLPRLTECLLGMTADPSAFVRGWVAASLAIAARRRPALRSRVLQHLAPLARDPRPAIRQRARCAVRLLTDPVSVFPPGWIKSPRLATILTGPGPQTRRRTSLIRASTFPSLSGKNPIHRS